MIEGHGDDAYRYSDITSDFSSNIWPNPTVCHAVAAYLSPCVPQLFAHYPEPEAKSLEHDIAHRHGISPSQVVVTSGATEAIYLVAQTFPLKPVIPLPTFSEYQDACSMFPTQDHRHSCLWLCNPNNPDGKVTPCEAIRDVTCRHKLVVIDQSYENYTEEKVMTIEEAAHYGNLIQIHSMSKTYGLPGLRLGYIVTSADMAAALRQNLRPWSVSPVAIEAGKYLLQHDDLICQPDFGEARRLRRKLEAAAGLTVSPGSTTFLLCQLQRATARQLKDYLARQHHMLIRDCSNFGSLTQGHFRVSTQSPAQNDALLQAINLFYDWLAQEK